MNFLHHKILLFYTLSLILSACTPCIKSNKVEQRIIFPSYSAQYDAATQRLTATVTFQKDNESGEFIKLSSDSYVFFNQDAMKQMSDKERPCYYFFEKTDVTECPETVQFNYANDEGIIFANQLKIKSIQINDLNLNKNQDNLLKYKGVALDEDETISLFLTKEDKQYEILPEVDENNQLIINVSMLQDLKSGSYEGHLQRTSYSTSVKAMDRGGNAVTTYYSKKYNITIQ